MQLLISFLCFLWSFFLVKNRKIKLLIFAMFLASPIIIVFRLPVEMPIKRWIACTLLFIYLRDIFLHRKHMSLNFPLKYPLALMFLGSILLIAFDQRFAISYRFLYPILDALDTYYPLFLGFYFVSSIDSIIKMYKPLLVCCFIVCLYGIFNYITFENPLVEFLIRIYEIDSRTFEIILYSGWEEVRRGVMSIYRYTFDFGYNSGLFLLLLFYYLLSYKKNNKIHYICLVLALGGIFLSASRTVMLSALFSLLLFFIFSYKSTKKTRIILFVSVVMLGSYLLIPPINNMVNLTIDTIFFQTKDLESGSSVSMRETQFLSALALWQQNPILGNGFKYIFLDLDWKNFTRTDGMAGFESIIYSLLIERGVVGIIVYVTLFLSIFIYYYKNLQYSRQLSALGLSIHIFFLLFAIGTGVLDSWLNTMLLHGILIKNIELSKLSLS